MFYKYLNSQYTSDSNDKIENLMLDPIFNNNLAKSKILQTQIIKNQDSPLNKIK